MTTKTTPKITLWEFFQQLGKTFMLPVALLSFCGIMLGIGSSLSSHDVITLLPVLGNPLLQAIFTWMSKVGSFAGCAGFFRRYAFCTYRFRRCDGACRPGYPARLAGFCDGN